MSSDPFCFLEQTDFSVRLARCANLSRPLQIQELIEVPTAEAAAMLAKIEPTASVVCALRPKPSQFHLATTDEAKRHGGPAGIRTLAAQPGSAGGPAGWVSAVQASDGKNPTNTPWLAITATVEAFAVAQAAFNTLKVKSRREVPAIFSTLGALANTNSKPVLILDIGEVSSHALLVGNGSVTGVQPVSLNLDQIAAAVQAELNLKFRGSAAKLFFNVDYDFSDTAAKIVERLVAGLKSDLAPLLGGGTAPSALFCSGLPVTQNWFAPELARALGLSLHRPDLKAWCESARITFATPEFAAGLSPAWIGLLHLVNASGSTTAAPAAWQPEWLALNSAPAAPVANVQPAAAPAPQPTPTPAPKVAAAPIPAVKSSATPVPAPAAATAAKPVAVATAVVAKPVAPVAKAPAAPAPAQKAVASSVSYSAKPTSTDKSSAKNLPKKAAEPTPTKSPSATPAPSAAPAAAMSNAAPVRSPAQTPRKNNLPLLIGGVAILLVLLLGGFYLYSQKQEAARLLAEKHQTEERLRAEEAKARLAQQKALEEAESRKLLEATAAQKLAQAEAARLQAENEARAQVAARLANARGTLVITTEPAGATVKVGDLPPRTSPATFADIRIGKYPVAISLARYGDAKLEFEVKENATTQPPVIPLERVFGTLELTTSPADAEFELHPANALMISPDARRTGRTPATLSDLSPDDYAITFTREGWTPHTEKVTITRGNTARIEWVFPNGAVHLTSTPEGATVTQAGATLGTTPLVLSDQHPGAVSYQLAMDGFDPVTLNGQIVAGAKLELAAEFPLEDRFYDVSAVDQKPEASNTKQPELPYYLTLENGRVDIELVVNRDGSTRNVRVAQSSNPDFGKYCLAAIAKWKFKPGLQAGQPVNVRMSVPFVFTKKKS